MLIQRHLRQSITQAATQFPVLAVMGPRQSGKTTLVQNSFPNHRYVSLEDFDTRELATADPRTFLTSYGSSAGLILDEIQNAPQLLSYMQTIVDREKKMGQFIITGSQNFLLNQSVSQTLAGRIAIVTLLPFSIAELEQANLIPSSIEEAVFKGSFPRIYADNVLPQRLYTNYIQTYIERDVRQLKSIENLSTFQKFVGLCAGRVGQLINLTALGNDCGIDAKTVRSWLSVLEASYVIFLLQPHHKNFGKRLVKSPKLYFIDTGLVCTLLRIKSADELIYHNMRGALVENFIIADLLKQQYNLERIPSLYFWRDQAGHEIDCIIDEGSQLLPLEIKSGRTPNATFFSNVSYFYTLADGNHPKGMVVYAGDEEQQWPDGNLVSWRKIGTLIK